MVVGVRLVEERLADWRVVEGLLLLLGHDVVGRELGRVAEYALRVDERVGVGRHGGRLVACVVLMLLLVEVVVMLLLLLLLLVASAVHCHVTGQDFVVLLLSICHVVR